MKQVFFRNWLFLRFCVAVLTVSVVVLPLTPAIGAAAETKAVSKKAEKVDKSKAVVLDDTKKAAASTPQEVAATEGSGVVEGGKKLTPEQTNNTNVAKTENIPPKSPVQAQPAQQPEEGLSTLAKVGIGVGAVAVVGGVVALAGGGGSSSGSSPSSPSSAKLVGQWNASAYNDEYGLVFYGVYNLYEIGSFTYDYNVSDGVHEQGTGTWTLDGNRLNTVSDHDSVFAGDFQGGNFTTITLHHAQLQWVLTLTKQ